MTRIALLFVAATVLCLMTTGHADICGTKDTGDVSAANNCIDSGTFSRNCNSPCTGTGSEPCNKGWKLVDPPAGSIGTGCQNAEVQECCIFVTLQYDLCECRCVTCLPPNEERQYKAMCGGTCGFGGLDQFYRTGYCHDEEADPDQCGFSPPPP
jgi:hypothetical protein